MKLYGKRSRSWDVSIKEKMALVSFGISVFEFKFPALRIAVLHKDLVGFCVPVAIINKAQNIMGLPF